MAALSLMYLKCWKVREGVGREGDRASTTQQLPASPGDGLPASLFTPSWSCPLHLAELWKDCRVNGGRLVLTKSYSGAIGFLTQSSLSPPLPCCSSFPVLVQLVPCMHDPFIHRCMHSPLFLKVTSSLYPPTPQKINVSVVQSFPTKHVISSIVCTFIYFFLYKESNLRLYAC